MVLCVSRFSSEEIYSEERGTAGAKSHREGHISPHKNSGMKGSIARSDSQV